MLRRAREGTEARCDTDEQIARCLCVECGVSVTAGAFMCERVHDDVASSSFDDGSWHHP